MTVLCHKHCFWGVDCTVLALLLWELLNALSSNTILAAAGARCSTTLLLKLPGLLLSTALHEAVGRVVVQC